MGELTPARSDKSRLAASSEDEDLTKTTKERLEWYEALEERAKGKRRPQRSSAS